MISSLALTQKFPARLPGKQQVTYTLDPYEHLEGPIRAIQKFVVILLTTKGSDPLHPWFGTLIPNITQMNVNSRPEIRGFSIDQCNDAISQFFRLQAEESYQNKQTGYDVISSIELTDITLTQDNHITLTFKFTPLKYESIIFSLNFNK